MTTERNTGSIPTVTMKFTEARPQLSELLNRVYNREMRVTITKGNIPVAAIVPLADLEQAESAEAERSRAFDTFREFSQAFADVPTEELESEIDRIAAEVRTEIQAEREAAAAR